MSKSNRNLVPIRNWVVAAENYGMCFEKNHPIEPEEVEAPVVKTPARKVKVSAKKAPVSP